MNMRPVAALIVAAGLALAGCSSSDNSDAPAVSGNAPSAPAAAPKGTSAKDVTAALAQQIPTVKTTVVYTEDSDPNKRMGRPHQYLSKTAFADSRIPAAEAKKDADGRKDAISYGGTVEVFATAEDAKAWADGIDKTMQSLGSIITPDYIYRSGRTVIRASSHLSPSQAAQYQEALGKAVS
ncbi:hypothetical protein PV350_13960 [Streptomyces sp. PA03-6a]|nr:hypothetical protein [Streptomyces sp. PA03-6a]